MNGNDSNRVLIALEAQFVFFFPFTAVRHLLRQPGNQTVNPESILRARGMQQLDQMQQICQPTLAINEPQQTGADIFAHQKFPYHANKTAVTPGQVIFSKSI